MATGVPKAMAAAPMYTENVLPRPPVYQQPPYHQQPPKEEQWSVGLFDCFSECGLCCVSCWCPCITFGQISEIIDEGSSSCIVNGALYYLIRVMTGCACIYSCIYRTKMRQKFNLEGSRSKDYCIHHWCEPCSLTQQYRELENRGYDVFNGWQGNVEGHRLGVAVPPVMGGAMKR